MEGEEEEARDEGRRDDEPPGTPQTVGHEDARRYGAAKSLLAEALEGDDEDGGKEEGKALGDWCIVVVESSLRKGKDSRERECDDKCV